MATTQTQTFTCNGCSEQTDNTTRLMWTHHDPEKQHGWAYSEGEQVSGSYCDDCVNDIQSMHDEWMTWIREHYEIDLDEDFWRNLALKIAKIHQKNTMSYYAWDDLTAHERLILEEELRDS